MSQIFNVQDSILGPKISRSLFKCKQMCTYWLCAWLNSLYKRSDFPHVLSLLLRHVTSRHSDGFDLKVLHKLVALQFTLSLKQRGNEIKYEETLKLWKTSTSRSLSLEEKHKSFVNKWTRGKYLGCAWITTVFIRCLKNRICSLKCCISFTILPCCKKMRTQLGWRSHEGEEIFSSFFYFERVDHGWDPCKRSNV